MTARFEGELHTRWLDDGRQMELTQPFCFHDEASVSWPVPAGAQTDGASIPRFLWSLIGGPFEGKYRRPAVVHDYYCDVRHREWQKVHRMFYDAMICAGVTVRQAKLLYFGVRLGGPRWTKQASHNVIITKSFPGDDFKIGYGAPEILASDTEVEIGSDMFLRLSEQISELSLKQIDSRADALRRRLF